MIRTLFPDTCTSWTWAVALRWRLSCRTDPVKLCSADSYASVFSWDQQRRTCYCWSPGSSLLELIPWHSWLVISRRKRWLICCWIDWWSRKDNKSAQINSLGPFTVGFPADGQLSPPRCVFHGLWMCPHTCYILVRVKLSRILRAGGWLSDRRRLQAAERLLGQIIKALGTYIKKQTLVCKLCWGTSASPLHTGSGRK